MTVTGTAVSDGPQSGFSEIDAGAVCPAAPPSDTTSNTRTAAPGAHLRFVSKNAPKTATILLTKRSGDNDRSGKGKRP